MTGISAQDVARLRADTGVAMKDCKQALEEASGDFNGAVELLRKRGLAQAAKRASRTASEGAIHQNENNKVIVLVEVNCETDFVLRNDDYKQFAEYVAATASNNLPETLDELKNLVEDKRAALVGKIGENIQISRYILIDKKHGHSYGSYSHNNGKIRCVIEINGTGSLDDVAREVAMHSAAFSPQFLRPEEIPSSVLEKEREIAREQVKDKPENVLEKIVEKKVDAFLGEVCLTRQKFMKDESLTVEQYVTKLGKEKGAGHVAITSSYRLQVGS